MNTPNETGRTERKTAFSEILSELRQLGEGKVPSDRRAEQELSRLKADAAERSFVLKRTERELSDEQARVTQLKREKAESETALSALGIFHGREKRALRDRIAGLEDALQTALSAEKEKKAALSKVRTEDNAAREAADAFETKIRKALWRRACVVLLGEDRIKENGNVFFGQYRFDDGKKPIEWRVLDVGKGVLLISEYAIDCMNFHTSIHARIRYIEDVYEPDTYIAKPIPVTWETCSLREWLNGEFLQEAFREDERALLCTVKVKADENPDSSVNPGNSTKDRVFLLSIQEAERYLKSFAERRCRPTPYSVSRWAYEEPETRCTNWWLRSPGRLDTSAAFVGSDGDIKRYGFTIFQDLEKKNRYETAMNNCVRPVICIGLQ